MAGALNTIDLDGLALKPGQGRRLDVEVRPDDLELGGQTYGVETGTIAARLEVSRTSAGHALHLTFASKLEGPCMRCLEASSFAVAVDAREIDQPGAADEELTSPYVDHGVLDVRAWAHDAIALSLPQTLLCRPDCVGLCPVCGVSLNEVDPATHKHEEELDPRWAKLRELRFD
ncbi:MAG TPA: DUF177 domain-containing protein [Solirubrobacterales bacterium]